MSDVFADTAGWANFFVRSEPFNQQAIELMRDWNRSQTVVVTSNYVLTELVALFSSPLRMPRPQQIQTIEIIKAASWVEIVHVTSNLDSAAWELLKNRTDKNWSLVDCSSMVIMKEREITDAFTSDHHFEQAGFNKLLR